MKISSISSFSPSKNNQKINNSSLKHNYQLQKDTVSFASKSIITNSFGENIKEATNFGKQVFNKLSRGAQQEELSSLIHQEYPEVEVKPMKELDIEDKDLYFAYYTHKINPDYTPKIPQLFVDIKGSNNATANMISACETAHEYTHLIQSYSARTFKEYEAISKGDIEYLEVVSGFGDSIFKYFDTKEQADMVKGVFGMQDLVNLQMYQKFVPRKCDVTKNMLITKSSYANEKEFRSSVNSTYDYCFDLMSRELLSMPDTQVLPRLKEKYKEIVLSGGLDKLKQDVRKYIAISARNEKEAYATESQLARTILKTTDSLNIDGFPLYYQMLENALKLS